MKTYTVFEYGSFTCDKAVEGYTRLPEKTFRILEEFVLCTRNKDLDALELMTVSARRGIGKIISANNYVGIISLKDGTTIQILPKTLAGEGGEAEAKAKKLLVDMLRTYRDFPHKSLQTAGVNTAKLDIFEIFIRMFTDEVLLLVKRGLSRGYETMQENGTCFKGKLLFTQHIRENIAHKERCYTQFDEFTGNRPENRLIKTTIRKLLRHTHSIRNRTDLKTLITTFAGIPESESIEDDFTSCVSDRSTRDYANALRWCRVFLSGKSFTMYEGSEVAFALLFPMETLFESYVAHQLKRSLNPDEFMVNIQDKKYHLFDEPRKFQMRPDIVVHRKADHAVFVLDTKWKVLSNKKNNDGISQADMYQMYAYQKKYGARYVTLLYPKTTEECHETQYRSLDGAIVRIRFVNLFGMRESMDPIVEMLNDLSEI